MKENTRRAISFLCLIIFHCFGTSICENDLKTKNPKIVIIGAGPSGIAAASKLFENGFKNVTILEAEDRIGGRVYTTKLGDYDVDLGGQWVHGEAGNTVFDLVYKLGLLDKSDEPKYGLVLEYFDSTGNQINEDIVKQISDFYFTYIQDQNSIQEAMNETYKSAGDYIKKAFDQQFKNTPEIYNDKKKYLHHLELFRTSWDAAESWDNISFIGGEYKDYKGDQMVNWKNRGYSTVLDVLMKRYPDPTKELPVMNNTILNSEVMSIDYLKNNEGPPIIITTTKGQLYKADNVIVTVSLGVLKEKYKTLFIPPLPDYKVETIQALGFGAVAKIYLLFEKPFWDLGNKRVLHFTFIWNDAEREMIENDPEKMWLLGVSGGVTVEYKPNLLELWISGKYAKAMEVLPEGKVFNLTVENLHRFLDHRYNVTQPIAMLRSQWYSNPHFRGTYSYQSVEADERKINAEMLEIPVTTQDPKILFAGEATSKTRYGTVDAAISSGWKAANVLLNHYKEIMPITE